MAKMLAKRNQKSNAKLARRRSQVPILHDSEGHRLSVYQTERCLGIRMANNAKGIKRLTQRHKEMIALHLAGDSNQEIAQKVGVYPKTVSAILNDPLAQQIIEDVYQDRRAEIKALAGEAIEAVRTGLRRGSITERLKAVDRFAKLEEQLNPEDNTNETAEDVCQRILSAIQINGENVQVNINQEPRDGNRIASGNDGGG